MHNGDGPTPSAGLEDTIARSAEIADAPPTPVSTPALDATALAGSGIGRAPLATALDITEAASSSDLPSARTALAAGSGTPAPVRGRASGFVAGNQIGRFVVSGELGAGGMGVVYAAYDPILDRKVAIKMLHEGISGSHRKRLEREARAMAKLSHPHVVAVHEVGDFDSRLFVAMEFVDGLTLRDWLTQKNPDRKEILRVMLEAGKGLAAAHAQGMVHRDFKPDNVLVGKDGRARVSDFGLVTPIGHDTEDAETAGPTSAPPTVDMAALTMVGSVMGTPLYMAPEQHQGEVADHRADQFSYCVTLWEALYKKTPYSAPSYEALVANVVGGLIQTPPKANQGAAWMRNLLTRGLSVDPAERFASMNDLLVALQRDPWKRRRVVAAGLAVLSLSGAAAFVLATQDDQGAKPCKDVDAPMREVWNPAKRETIQAAFLQSGAPEVAARWPKIDKQLTDYAQDWRSLRTQTCLASQEQSEEFSSLALHCFERRLDDFRWVIELFSSAPNDKVVQSASKSIDDLDAVAYCSNPDYLASRVPLPTDAADRQELARLEGEYQGVVTLDRRGQYQEALASTGELLPAARALDYSPLLAKLLVLRGALQQTLGDGKAAEKTLRAAAVAAADAKDDPLQAKAWIYLLDLLVSLGRYDEALSIETIATTSAQRVPDELGLQARLYNTLGGIYIAKGRYDDAYVAYDKALTIQRRLGREGNLALAPAIANLGLARWYAGEINAAKLAFEEALAIMLEDYGPDHSMVAYAHKNLGDLEMQLSQFALASPHYDEVVRIWKASLGEDHVNLAYAYEQMAMVAVRTGKLDEAQRYADMTMDLRLRHLGNDNALTTQGRTVAVEVYLEIGTEESLRKAEQEIETSLQVQMGLGEAGRRQILYVLDARAKLSEARGDWKTALQDRQRALELRLELLPDDHPDVGYSLTRVAKLGLQLGKIELAEKTAKRAQAMFDAKPEYGDSAVAMRRLVAAIRMHQGDLKNARATLLDAIDKAATCECTVANLSAHFDLARLDSMEGDAEGVARARSIREQIAASREGADITRVQQAVQALSEMDAWLASVGK